MKLKIILLCVLLLLLVAESAYAMSSPAYRIDWTNLLTGGGGPASSGGYRVNFTVGQTVSDESASPQYKVQMGYWAGNLPQFEIFVPRIAKNP